MVVVVTDTIRERSTEAARQYVRVTRDRLSMEEKRYGPQAHLRRSYQELQRSIDRDELARTWPHADLGDVLDD